MTSTWRRSSVLMMTAASLAGCSQEWIDAQPGLGEDARPETIQPLDMLGPAMHDAPDREDSSTPTPVPVPRMLADGASSVVSLGLDGFREALLRNNLELDVARFDPAIAATRVMAEQGRLDMTLAANALASREIEDASANNLPIYALESDYLDAAAGLAIPLATGGEVWLEGDLYRYQTEYL